MFTNGTSVPRQILIVDILDISHLQQKLDNCIFDCKSFGREAFDCKGFRDVLLSKERLRVWAAALWVASFCVAAAR